MSDAVTVPDTREGVPAAWTDPGRHPGTRAVEVSISGVVQGVGFRPYVHRLAARNALAGWVRNEPGAVRVRLEGRSGDVARMLEALPTEAPPLARIDRFEIEEREPEGLAGFTVGASDVAASGRLPVSPDVATCAACEAELSDPGDRRYRYPFITCTDCGPRFTVIESMPYDRERTSMRAFRQCPACAREYGDPADRRYHSETNSCPECGPRIWLEGPNGRLGRRASGRADADEVIAEAGRALLEGRIVALRGLGGFHLAVRADSEGAVLALRERKERDAKPLALMVRDVDAARKLAHVSEAEAQLLRAPERPIVVLVRAPDAGLAPSVSPGLDTVAVMLPYTPLHHLLLEEVGGVPLVMTSGNVSDEPIAITNEEARKRLPEIADLLLLHDREIVARYDDSVMRVPGERAGPAPLFLRRSRGYAPVPLRMPTPLEDGILAVGPHLKNTFTLAAGADAFVSQHVGDLECFETLDAFKESLERFRTIFRVTPTWVVRDLHPAYLSTRIAHSSGIPELTPVQHHHAHVAAVAGEHGVTGRVLGVAFDGTGYGTDGRVWGCELLVSDLVSFERAAQLRYAPLPGGDRAVRTPWRVLLGYASLDPDWAGSDGAEAPAWVRPALAGVEPVELAVASRQIDRALNAPLASSMGRLFDAAAALLGVRSESSYEGQAAMELEALAGRRDGRVLPFPVVAGAEGTLELDPIPLLRALAGARAAGRPTEACAADFHETVASASVALALRICDGASLDTVALGGGCFQNVRLLGAVERGLSEAGVTVLRPRLLGPNDGAVSYGQAVVAAARLSQ